MTDEYMQYMEAQKNQKLFEMEDLYQSRLDEFIPAIQDSLNQSFQTVVALQKNGRLGEISYLEYTFLYTNLINQKDAAQMRVYDDNWYFDPYQRVIGEFDYSLLFTKYWELWTQLLSGRKRSAKAATAKETISFLLSCASQFYKYIAAAVYFSILPCISEDPFQSILRADEFEINVGEYMAYTKAVYKENRNRSLKATLDWFALREEYDYAFEAFCGLDFSGADLSEIDLRYADLRHAAFKNTDFEDSLLYGARFCHANLQGANFCYSQIHEADFTGADLANARFCRAYAYRGAPDPVHWLNVGYRSVNFHAANLTNADFTHASIYDADFTGANMTGAKLDRAQLERFALSFEQKQSVTVIDG